MKELELLLESCKSGFTRQQYDFCMQKYFKFVGEPMLKDPKEIEAKIIEYIISLKKEGMSYNGISNYITPVKSFYAINDIAINSKRINRFMPENRRHKIDRAYSHKEISKLLEIADDRSRVLILVLASTGIRIGALPSIRLRNLQDTKLVVYEGDKEQYFTFITPECKQAIDSYIDMRARYGEKINDDSYLIREQFDIKCPAKPKPVEKSGLQFKLYDLCDRAGIDRKNIMIAHGFRKFFTTQLVNSKVNPEIREMLLGHKIGLASAYYKPSEQDMFSEYQKAINNLTINEENRLKLKVQLLENEKTNYEKLDARIDELQRLFYKNNVTVGGPEGIGRAPTDEEIEQDIRQRRWKDKHQRERDRRLLHELNE